MSHFLTSQCIVASTLHIAETARLQKQNLPQVVYSFLEASSEPFRKAFRGPVCEASRKPSATKYALGRRRTRQRWWDTLEALWKICKVSPQQLLIKFVWPLGTDVLEHVFAAGAVSLTRHTLPIHVLRRPKPPKSKMRYKISSLLRNRSINGPHWLSGSTWTKLYI